MASKRTARELYTDAYREARTLSQIHLEHAINYTHGWRGIQRQALLSFVDYQDGYYSNRYVWLDMRRYGCYIMRNNALNMARLWQLKRLDRLQNLSTTTYHGYYLGSPYAKD